MVAFEALVHMTAWVVTEVASASWDRIISKLSTQIFLQCGMASVLAMTVILMTSPSIIRHAFYETFLNTHIILMALALVGIWIHCDVGQLPQLPYLQAVVGLWLGDRLLRLARVFYIIILEMAALDESNS
jgi:DMSO/TMAO reductase YedYZ heme-binding membrane subunit